MEKWKAVPDEVVRHVWQCQEKDCDCDNPTAYISPERYRTPVCECDQDMTYLYTEVVDSSEGEDGDLAFVETIPTDEIPKLFEKEKTMKTHTMDFCFNVKSEKDCENLTGEELKQALLERINKMNTDEFVEACGHIDTTYDDEEIG